MTPPAPICRLNCIIYLRIKSLNNVKSTHGLYENKHFV